ERYPDATDLVFAQDAISPPLFAGNRYVVNGVVLENSALNPKVEDLARQGARAVRHDPRSTPRDLVEHGEHVLSLDLDHLPIFPPRKEFAVYRAFVLAPAPLQHLRVLLEVEIGEIAEGL